MSGAITRMGLAEARALAEEVVELLEQECERVEIAGSIRRGKADVGDLEIVAIPDYTILTDLFGNETGRVDLLHALCQALIVEGVFGLRLDKNGQSACGKKYKRLTYKGVPLDLFATTADQWGVIFLIRSGPAEFSHWLVTPKAQGGAMPPGMNVKDGALWKHGQIIPTPEESDVFREVGLAYLEPHERTPAAARRVEGAGE